MFLQTKVIAVILALCYGVTSAFSLAEENNPDGQVPWTNETKVGVTASSQSPSDSDNSRRSDIIIDSSFCVVYIISFVVIIAISIRNFLRFPQMVNQANVLIVTLLGLTLFDRVLCLLYSLLWDKNQDIEPHSMKSFLYFELPFWYLNMASVIQFFEWSQFVMFLTLPAFGARQSTLASTDLGQEIAEDYQAPQDEVEKRHSSISSHQSSKQESEDNSTDKLLDSQQANERGVEGDDGGDDGDETETEEQDDDSDLESGRDGSQRSQQKLRRSGGHFSGNHLTRIEELLTSHKRNRNIMLVILSVLLLVLLAIEIAYSVNSNLNWQLDLLKVVKGVMTVAYGIIFMAFAPLFILGIVMLERKYPGMYARMRFKLIAGSIIFMLVMGIRLTIYILIQFSNIAFLVETYRGEIPLYISEILITMCYIQIMARFYKKKMSQKQPAQQQEQPTEDPLHMVQEVYIETDQPTAAEAENQHRQSVVIDQQMRHSIGGVVFQGQGSNPINDSTMQLRISLLSLSQSIVMDDPNVDYKLVEGAQTPLKDRPIDGGKIVPQTRSTYSSPYKSNDGQLGQQTITSQSRKLSSDCNNLDISATSKYSSGKKSRIRAQIIPGLQNLAGEQTGSEKQRTILATALAGRKISDDYEVRAYALSDSHFGTPSQFANKRESINSSQTMEAESDDDSSDEDDPYKSNDDDSSDSNKSFEDRVSKNPLRLSARHLTKPRMNPKSFDSDDDMKIFSKEQDHYLVYGSKRTGGGPQGIGAVAAGGASQEEFKMTEGEAFSSAYDQASSVAKRANTLTNPRSLTTQKNTTKKTAKAKGKKVAAQKSFEGAPPNKV